MQSILDQTFGDIELIAIDDGSTDSTPEILDGFSRRDGRIRVIRRTGRGLVPALNEGLALSRGKYVARMDADDVARPERLFRQVEYLEANTGCIVLGTAVRVFGAGLRSHDIFPEPDSDALRFRALFQNPIYHPTVLLRSSTFKSAGLAFDPDFQHAEDYDLWARAMEHGSMANLPLVLLDYRRHAESVGSRHNAIQVKNANRIRQRLIHKAFGIFADNRTLILHGLIGSLDKVRCVALRKDVQLWINRLGKANLQSGYVGSEIATSILDEYREWLMNKDMGYVKGLLFSILRRRELQSLLSL